MRLRVALMANTGRRRCQAFRYCGREDCCGVVDGGADGLADAASAVGSFGSAAMMLIGGIEDEDGKSRLGSTEATGGTGPRERGGTAEVTAFASDGGSVMLAVGTAAESSDPVTVGVGRDRGTGTGAAAGDSARSEPASAIVAAAAAVGVGTVDRGTASAVEDARHRSRYCAT